MTAEKIRVLIADDHRMFRDMLKNALGELEDMDVVGQARDGTGAIEMTLQEAPHVLILDVMLPDMTGVEVIRALHKQAPRTRVLVLTDLKDETPLLESLMAGARGYLLKDASIAELVRAVRLVHQGQAVLHPQSTLQVIEELRRSRSDSARRIAQNHELLRRLTPRELEVLQLVGQGCSNKEIGERLFISEKTAKTHVANLLRRISVKDRMAAAIVAVKAGLCE